MRQLTENKDRFIDKNPNLTFEQAQEVKKFFNTHNEAEALMGNWQNDSDKWTYDDFKKVIYDYEHRNTKSNADRIANRKGIDGIKLGYDYLDLGEYTTESWGTFHAYSPLTHLGAKTLAGPQVPPVQKDKDSAAWCIGYSGDDYYWNERCDDSKYDDYFIIICGEKVPTFKVCLEISGSYSYIDNITVWDYFDSDQCLKYYMDKYFSEEDCDTIRNLIKYAEEQGAYDERVFDGDVFSGEAFADEYWESLYDSFLEHQEDMVEQFGKDKVTAAMNECDAINPLDDLTATAEDCYYYTDCHDKSDVFNRILLYIDDFFEEIEDYIVDQDEED